MPKSKRFLDLEMPKSYEPDFQQSYFRNLRNVFRKAYDPKTDTLNSEKIIQFWYAMYEARFSQQIGHNWASVHKPMLKKDAPQSAEKYNAHLLKEHPELFPRAV